jgi:acyl-CoA thioester hydrolase
VSAAAAPPPFTFTMAKRVRWAEVDPQSVVFNGHYLTYADIGFTEYMRAIGRPFPDPLDGSGTEIFVVRAELDFRSPARFDDMIDLHVRTARIGRSSFTVATEIRRAGTLLTQIRNTYAHADPAAGTSLPLPEGLIASILDYERTPPDR